LSPLRQGFICGETLPLKLKNRQWWEAGKAFICPGSCDCRRRRLDLLRA
jgi:hypothetical protein